MSFYNTFKRKEEFLKMKEILYFDKDFVYYTVFYYLFTIYADFQKIIEGTPQSFIFRSWTAEEDNVL